MRHGVLGELACSGRALAYGIGNRPSKGFCVGSEHLLVVGEEFISSLGYLSAGFDDLVLSPQSFFGAVGHIGDRAVALRSRLRGRAGGFCQAGEPRASRAMHICRVKPLADVPATGSFPAPAMASSAYFP